MAQSGLDSAYQVSPSRSCREASLGRHNHRPAELVEQKPGGLVAAAELPVKMERGHATLVRCNQIRRPEPGRKRVFERRGQSRK